MVAPATTASDGSLTTPLSRAVVYWAHTTSVDPKIRRSRREKQVNQRAGNGFRNFLFICLPSLSQTINCEFDPSDLQALRLREFIHSVRVCQLFCSFMIDPWRTMHESSINPHILNDPAYGAVGAGPVRHQVTAQGEKQPQQLAEQDIHWRTTIIRYSGANVRREIPFGETIPRQFGMSAHCNLSFHESLLYEFLQQISFIAGNVFIARKKSNQQRGSIERCHRTVSQSHG